MRYKETQDRNQLCLFNSLEDLVSPQNPVRLIEALLEGLYQKDSDQFDTGKGSKTTGRKAYSSVLLCKLFLYGYLHRISSSRALEGETHRNIEVMWLIHGLHPDHKTIADFRKDNGKLIRHVTTSFRLFLKETGFIKGEKLAYDGTKIKACTKKEVLTYQKVMGRLTHIEEEIEKYLMQLDRVDSLEIVEERVWEKEMERQHLESELSKLRDEVSRLESYKRVMDEKKQTSYCLNDPDARLMPSRDGWIPAYNIQMGIDGANKMISSAEVTTYPNDINALEENVVATQDQLGELPKIVIADTGYANTTQMRAVESNNKTTCYIPLGNNPHTKSDKQKGLHFVYNQEENIVRCVEGQTLYPLARNVKKNGQVFKTYRPKKGVCLQCPRFNECTKSPNGRVFHIGENAIYHTNYSKRQASESFKKIFKERKGLVEHPFGTLKRWMGKVPLLLCSREKVQIEIDIYTTAYNLRRLLNLRPMEELLRLVSAY